MLFKVKMMIAEEYFRDPIVAAYFHIPFGLKTEEERNSEIDKCLTAVKEAEATSVWVLISNVKDGSVSYLLNRAFSLGLRIVPVFQPFISIVEHPEVKIVCADGSTSDDPRYFNIGCFNHPYLMEKTRELVKGFLEQFKDHPALYRIAGLPLISFIHEAYYRTDIPEFGGGPLKPCCYCKHCIEKFRELMKERYRNIETFNSKHGTKFGSWDSLEPPREPSNPSLWKEWLDFHADIIPKFLHEIIEFAKSITPILSTHELNDFYPCTYQCVYSGNDIWRMARVIDVGHEDMYPLEFDHRYLIYVYEYIKDAVRAAIGFNRLYTANGQSFNSWLGYKIPAASMFEQVYSCLIHGSLGLVWWVDWKQIDLWAKTKQPNREYSQIIGVLKDYEISKAEVALIYPWTSMELKRDDIYCMDNLLFYMALARSSIPVDIISERQVEEGILDNRGYKVLCAIGCPALPPEAAAEIKRFVENGGVLIQDYEGQGVGEFKSAYPEMVLKPMAEHVFYTVKTEMPLLSRLNGKIITLGIENLCEELSVDGDLKIIARFEDGKPALIAAKKGSGIVIKAATLLGWDYSNYPGHYDFAVMFPFIIRRNEYVREMILGLLKEAGVQPPAESTNPNVEVGVWRGRESLMVFVVNHLDQASASTVTVNLSGDGKYVVQDFFNKEVCQSCQNGRKITFKVDLTNFQGKAYIVKKIS
jgi:hypothetical protein